MTTLVLDLETTVQRFDGKTDNSPFNPDNKLVSAHFGRLGWDTVDEVHSLVFHHDQKPEPDSRQLLEDMLWEADILVCHNAKFDCAWLREMGFTLPSKIVCTMVQEYCLSKGQRRLLSLKETAKRRQVTNKKSDLIDELFKSGVGFESMPLATVLEYAEADVRSCGEIYLQQVDEFKRPENQSLQKILDLSHDMLLTLLDFERNGIKIDREALIAVEDEFKAEQIALQKRLNDIVDQVMGDWPINLNSGADMTKVIYSRKVTNRDEHRRIFNIGVNANGKPLRTPRMNKAEFASSVRKTTEVVKRAVAICCDVCDGRGRIQKIKKDGQPFKNLTKCPSCDGAGALYQCTGKVAGLKLSPVDASFASINGFKTDKATLRGLIGQARLKNNDLAIEFLEKIIRLNAVSVYLDSFVKGIKTWTRQSGLLHTNFNQCVTATGRLSSTNPNFQNQPKRGFPIRKCVVSRFEGGCITEADFSSLEWICAGELSRDPQILTDIKNKKDVHRQTASIINQIEKDDVSKDQRQEAKAFTFAPLYGGMGAGEEPHVQAYFKEFFQIYRGLAGWHKQLMDGVMKTNVVQTPSGRQYEWPNAKRYSNGQISNATQVKNYPVQGFGNDLVQLSCIRAQRRFKELNLHSLIILSVHDSIVVDTHPAEVEAVSDALTWAMTNVLEEAEERWGYEFALPLPIEIETGQTWLQ